MLVCLFPRSASSHLFPVQSKDNMQVLPKIYKDVDDLHWYNTSKQTKFKKPRRNTKGSINIHLHGVYL